MRDRLILRKHCVWCKKGENKVVNAAKFYADLIVSERTWSWAVVGIVYLVGTLFIRSAIFRGLVRETKQTDPHLYSETKRLYLKNCITGWVVFSVSFFLIIGVWIGWKNSLVEKGPLALFCLLLPLLFFLSIILHLIAYAEALLSILRQRTGVEREF